MKIAVTSAIGWPYVRRGSRFTYELASYLSRKGHETHYITSKPGMRSRSREQNGIYTEYHRLAGGPLLSIIQVEKLDTFIVPCMSAILREDFDIVQTVLPMDAFAASMTKILKGTPFVHYMIDSFQPHYYITRFGKYMLRTGVRSAVQVTAPSRFIIDDVRKNFGIDALLTPPPVDTDQFTPCETKDLQCPKILYTSSIHDPRKGFLMLVRAFEKLLDHVPDARLQLSGHVHPKAIEAIFQSVGHRTGKSIEILGVGRREDLPILYRNAAVTVLPSLNEAFGMVLLESLASGTPIVGMKSGGIPDIFSLDGVGVLSEPDGGQDELCRALLKGLELAQDAGVWKKCRRHAESFSWNALGPQFEKLYEKTAEISNKKKSRRAPAKDKKAPEVSHGQPAGRSQPDKTDLGEVFYDALDEIEIDYDNYCRVDRCKPLCTYVAGWLLGKGLRRSKVLVLGFFIFPMKLLLEKCGFTVKGIEITRKYEPWNDLGDKTIMSDVHALKDEPGNYDIIICDDILQYHEFPVRTLQIIREKLNREGTLILVAENAANGDSRFLSLMRKKKHTARHSDAPDEGRSMNTGKGSTHCSGYALEEAEKLVAASGFSVSQGSYIVKEKAVESGLFSVPVFSYLSRRLYYLVQNAYPLLRSHVFVAARREPSS